MKKLLTFIVLSFLLSNTVFAQWHRWKNIEHSQTRKHYTKFQQKQRDSIISNNITKSVRFIKYYNKKGKLKRSIVSTEKYYDSVGDLIQENYYTHKGKLHRTYKYVYNKEGIETSYRSYNAKGKLLRGWDLSFNDKGLMSKATNYWKREGNISWVQTYEYDADSNAIKIQSLNKRNQVTSTAEYEYYEDGQKKEVRRYNKKGKLKSVIKYDCTPTGTLANGRKTDTTTVCRKDNIDEDGNTIYTYETMLQNGKIQRSITKVSADKKHSEITVLNHNGKLIFKRTYTKNEKGNLKETTFYYPKNSKRNRYIRYTFDWADDNKQLTTSQYGYKNRLIATSTVVSY